MKSASCATGRMWAAIVAVSAALTLLAEPIRIDVTARPDMAARIRRAKPPEYVRPPANYAPISSSPSSYSSPSSPPPMPVADASDIPLSATEEEPPAEEPSAGESA